MNELLEEFKEISNNTAYELAFSKRMLRPDPSRPGEFLGNTQRSDFVAVLKELVAKLPASPQIFDIGGGSGETTVDLALRDVAKATVNLVEPNPVLLAQYHRRLEQAPNLKLGITHRGVVEDFYRDHGKVVTQLEGTQDLVLNIHVIYHLTDFHAAQFNPDKDILDAVRFMFSCLKPGGSIFIVCADQLVSTSGQAARYYFEKIGKSETAKRLLQIAECRKRLLCTGEIANLLNNAFSDRKASHASSITDSYWYGDSAADIVAICITGEIGEIDDKEFDVQKLVIAGEFVEQHPDRIGLAKEEREVPQKGMVRSNQPQMIAVIKREV
jgi:SAM-dependent methyltransferase